MLKKRIAVVLLVLILCFALLPDLGDPAAADVKLSFISINDTLPPELIGCATTYGGMIYVPYYVFTNYGFGIYYSYFAGNATAYLFRGDNQLFFELGTGVTYDGDDYRYSTPAIMRSGTVYVPLAFPASFFGGIRYASIPGNEYGSILRIADGREVLTDDEFLRTAKSLMRTYWLNYQPTATPAPQTPVPTSSQIPAVATPVPTEEVFPHKGERIVLSFLGLPANGVLERLQRSGVRAGFFLTAEDVRSSPDAVRQLVGSGHAVGVCCTEDLAAEYPAVCELLFAAARVRPELVTLCAEDTDAFREQAEMASLVFCGFDHVLDLPAPEGGSIYTVTAALETGSGGAALLLRCAEENQDLDVLLRYLEREKFEICAPRETG
jgi:hypothetical protein